MSPRTGRLATARTWLFVPGDRPDRFGRAKASGAQVVIVDLEDAVAPASKHAAREAVHAELQGASDVVVRINAAGTPEHEADMLLLASVPAAAFGAVMVPMVECADDVTAVHRQLGDVPVIGLVETARGIEALGEITRAPGLVRLAFGSADFATDVRAADDACPAAYARARLVVTSRATGLPAPLDGPTLALTDADAVAAETRRARATGMGGKLCVHPAQVPVVAAAFTPTPVEVAQARAVLARVDDGAPGGAVAANGRMVDGPVVVAARAVLEEAEDT